MLNLVGTMIPQRLFANTNPIMQLRAYNEPLPLVGDMKGTIQPPLGVGTNRGHQIPQPFIQPPLPPHLETTREEVQELYGLGLRQIGSPKFYNEGFRGWQHLLVAAEKQKILTKTHPRTPSSIKTGSTSKRRV